MHWKLRSSLSSCFIIPNYVSYIITDFVFQENSTEYLSPHLKGYGVSCSAKVCSPRSGSTELHVRLALRETHYSPLRLDIPCGSLRIDRDGVIKVADFGLTEDMYGTNYFRRERGEGGSEEKVPIRWMAPESIEEDIYAEATDVVRSDNTHHDYYSELW